MLFGYALAVVAGYLLARLGRVETTALLSLWLAARLAWFLPAVPPVALAALQLAFPFLLFIRAGLPFLRVAKSLRNAVFALPLAGFLIAALVFQAGAVGGLGEGEGRGLLLAIDLLSLLLFVMGGRIIAAATSGALQRRGTHPKGFAQIDLERAGVTLLLAMALLDALRGPDVAAGGLALVSGALILIRLAGWRVWRTAGDPEVAVLHLGYAWLGLGLLLKGGGQALDLLPLADALHGITVGALGTLSLAMMLRTARQRTRQPTAPGWPGAAALALVSIAALARLAAGAAEAPMLLLAISALTWTCAFLVLLALLAVTWRTAQRMRRSLPARSSG